MRWPAFLAPVLLVPHGGPGRREPLSRQIKKRKPYPYPLPPLPNSEAIPANLSRRDLWNAKEFFRIEALLRSETVARLFRRANRQAARSNTTRAPEPQNVNEWIAWYGQNKIHSKNSDCAAVRRILGDKSLLQHFSIDDSWAILKGSHHRFYRSNTVRASPDVWNVR